MGPKLYRRVFVMKKERKKKAPYQEIWPTLNITCAGFHDWWIMRLIWRCVVLLTTPGLVFRITEASSQCEKYTFRLLHLATLRARNVETKSHQRRCTLDSTLYKCHVPGNTQPAHPLSLDTSRTHAHIILSPVNPSKTGVYRGIHYFSHFCSFEKKYENYQKFFTWKFSFFGGDFYLHICMFS